MSTPREIIRNVIDSEEVGARVIRQLEANGLVIVPRVATERMLEAAWAAAHEEKAKDVWDDMITEYLLSNQ
jgi:hypothetical protein